MIGSATSLISAALALPALAYVFSPLQRGATSGWAEAGDIRSLPVNEPAEMVFRKKRTDGWKTIIEKASAWVVKSSDGEVVAFAPHCTHLGCGYHWDENNNNFLCPATLRLFPPTEMS